MSLPIYLSPYFGIMGGVTTPVVTTDMPVGNILDTDGVTVLWRQDYIEDFNTNVAVTGFVNSTTGDTGMFDAAYPGGAAYRNSWKAGSPMQGTSEPNTFYDAVSTMSVSNSILRTDMYINADGTLRASKFKPIFGNGVDFSLATKIIVKYKSGGDTGFSYVFDWIGSDTDWLAGGGEFGDSENPVNGEAATGDLHLYYRPKVANSGLYNANIVSTSVTGVKANNWTVNESTWVPGVSLATKMNGNAIWSTTDRVWTTPKRWVQQGGGSATTPGQSGYLEIDWCVAYTYVGP